MTKTAKLLIFDAIAELPLGKEMHEAFQQIGVESIYADSRDFKQKKFYKFRGAYRKALNRMEGGADRFYHFPKLVEQSFEQHIAKALPSHLLVIGCLYKYLKPAFLKELQSKYHFKIYLYDTDSCNLYPKRREFLFFIDNELPIYDEIFSFSKVTTQFFAETKKLKASFLPFGAKPIKTQSATKAEINVLFVGSADLRRVFLLENIKDVVTIYGGRWRRNYPLMSDGLKKVVKDETVWGERLQTLLASTKIVININRTHFYGAGTGVNLRVFEALAAGAFLLTDYCDELDELFDIGSEIEVFRSNQELVSKVMYYLAHPDKRQEIAKRGHERFLKHHTWQVRVAEVKEKMD